VLTSAQKGEGKSTTAYALGRAFASMGLRVIVVDADMRRPSLHKFTDRTRDAEEKGLSSLLAGQVDIEEALTPSSYPGLSYVFAGVIPPDPAKLLSGPNLAAVVSDLMNRCDLLIVDAPPVLGLADAPTLASLGEATLFVAEADRPHRGQAKNAVRRLHLARAQVIGGVLTKFEPRRGAYYAYDYDYTYGQDNAA
jgi:capsular exopolysaccharide synthesis family protein